MKVYIVCPIQETEGFSVDVCRKCRFFEFGKSVETGKLSASCRKQKTRMHKINFEMAYFTDYLGRPDEVIVEAKQDEKVVKH